MTFLHQAESNLKLLFSHYSFDDYQEFYQEYFLKIPEIEIDGTTLFEEEDHEYE